MCQRHSFILTPAGQVLDGIGMTDSHTTIRELHGLHHTNDKVNAYEWQPPAGWPETNWLDGLTKDTEVFTLKSSHLDAMERHVKTLYPTMAEWDAGDKVRDLTPAERAAAVLLLQSSEFVTVPETTLPNGQVVPAFRVAKYAMARGANAIPISVADVKPWADINYHESRSFSARAGLSLVTETQMLAIAWNIAQQPDNWTGGKVGEGNLFQGLRYGSRALPANAESENENERRWHVLSNGERIYDFAGNVFTWVFDDVQGDEKGIVAGHFAEDSVSLTAPFPSMERGTGWRPSAGNWSGFALVRGGCWSSASCAGVFDLGSGRPVSRYGNAGFRCTTPIGL